MSASPVFTLTKPSGTALLQACKAISTALSTSAGAMEGVYLDILRAQREHAPLSGRSESARPAVRRGASNTRKVGRGPAVEVLSSRTGLLVLLPCLLRYCNVRGNREITGR